MTTDNTQELDEILERYRLFANMAYSEVEDGFRTVDEFKGVALPRVLDEAKQAILSLINKQVEEVLDRLEATFNDAHIDTVIEAERERINKTEKQ